MFMVDLPFMVDFPHLWWICGGFPMFMMDIPFIPFEGVKVMTNETSQTGLLKLLQARKDDSKFPERDVCWQRSQFSLYIYIYTHTHKCTYVRCENPSSSGRSQGSQVVYDQNNHFCESNSQVTLW